MSLSLTISSSVLSFLLHLSFSPCHSVSFLPFTLFIFPCFSPFLSLFPLFTSITAFIPSSEYTVTSLLPHFTSLLIHFTSLLIHFTSLLIHFTSFSLHFPSYSLHIFSYSLHIPSHSLHFSFTSLLPHLTSHHFLFTTHPFLFTSHPFLFTSLHFTLLTSKHLKPSNCLACKYRLTAATGTIASCPDKMI